MLAPVNRIPPEVLTLIPDSWDKVSRGKDLIALTHVCRAWREMFISRSSLWTDFHCVDADKTRVYLERSKSSLITLLLDRDEYQPPYGPCLQIISRDIGRLKSLVIQGTQENLQDIATYLSHPTPLLEDVEINGHSQDYPTLTTAFFDGDLSFLRKLSLRRVHTQLPWRNMANLTSFTLSYPEECEVSIGQLLDFLESAPSLLEVRLYRATPTSSAQNGRVVSLSCLKKIVIKGDEPFSLFLDHLLIPVGTKMSLEFGFGALEVRIEDYLPRSLDNLKNLSGFTGITLYFSSCMTRLQFTGPNGRVSMLPVWEHKDRPFGATHRVFQSLALFNTSMARQLEIEGGRLPPGSPLPHQVLTSTKNIQTLKLVQCQGLLSFIRALDPNLNQSNPLACPRLEELVLYLGVVEPHVMESIADMAAARALEGAGLKSIHLVCPVSLSPLPSGIAEHVCHVKTCSMLDAVKDDSEDSSDDYDW